MAWCDVVELRTLRACRIELGQSQAAFAAMLGVSPESYRTWDAGQRATPPKVLARARALATHQDDHKLRAGSPPHARSPTAARWSAARPSSDARRRARRRPRQVRAQPVPRLMELRFVHNVVAVKDRRHFGDTASFRANWRPGHSRQHRQRAPTRPPPARPTCVARRPRQ